MYFNVLLAIAKNRSEEITQIFFSFKIMEFLYKQLDLEFEITQIQQRLQQALQAAQKDQAGTNLRVE